MSTNDDHYVGLPLEEIRDQNKAVLEAVTGMQQQVAFIPEIREDIHNLKYDVHAIKRAIKETSKDLHTLDQRVTRLETRVA